MPHIHVELLGPFRLSVEGVGEAQLSMRKAVALLGYLAVLPDVRHSREKLSSLLWGEQVSTAARSNLRQCLAVLRRELGHRDCKCIVNDGSSIYLKADECRTDLREFASAIALASTASLEQAHCLYRSHFLEGFTSGEAEFDEWLTGQRRLNQERYLHSMNQLLRIYTDTVDYPKVIELSLSLLAIDPLQESVHRSLMSAYGAQGRRRAVLTQYEQCRTALMDELGLEPSNETRSLMRRLLSQVPVGLESTPTSGEIPVHASTESVIASQETIRPSGVISPTGLRAPTHRYALGAAVLLLALLSFREFRIPRSPPAEDADPVSATTSAASTDYRLSTHRPAIAVVPFHNLSEDESQQYFSDGLTEDLITDLSLVSGLRVISRSSSFIYRGTDQSKDEIAEVLGVRYILDGSVRRVGSGVRVNAYLVDTHTGVNIWADRYDRNIADILALQDDLTRTIVSALSVNFSDMEQHHFDRTDKVDAEAYDLLLRGLQPFRTFTNENNRIAREFFEQSIAVDPRYARAHANLALSYGREILFRYSDAQAEIIQLGLQSVQRAEALDDRLPQVEFAKAVLYLADKQHERAVEAARRAVALDPNYADGYAVLAQTLAYSGYLAEAGSAIATAKSLNPIYPFGYHFVEGHIHYQLGQYEQAVAALKEASDRNPSFYLARLLLAATYARLGMVEEADWQIAEASILNPDISLNVEEAAAVYSKPQHLRHYLEGLSLAGLSDTY